MAWPTTPLDIEFSLAFNADMVADPLTWTWTVITPFVYVRDGCVITRGRPDEQSLTQPATCTVTVDDRDGRFCPRNPMGPYFQSFGNNTPFRARVNPGSGYVTRFVGFVSEWPPRWDLTGKDRYVKIQADGVLRRLGQGRSALESTLRKAIPASAPAPLRYWPIEDGARSTAAGPGLPTHGSMFLAGAVKFADTANIDGSGPIANFSPGGTLSADLSGTTNGAFSIEFSGTFPDAGASFYVPLNWLMTGALGEWHFLVLGTAVQVVAYDGGGTQTVALSFNPSTFVGAHNWCVTAVQNGANIDCQIFRDGVLADTGTIAAVTLGRIRKVAVNPFKSTLDVSIGHLAVWNSADQVGHFEAFTGNAGELSGIRASRLGKYELKFVDTVAGSTEAMGAQTVKTLVDLLRECEAAEAGLLIERLNGRLGFDPHTIRENRALALTLDYALGHLSPPLEPTDDDQRTRNDVTVTRERGSYSRVEQLEGRFSTNPVIGVGRYTENVTLNVGTDEQTLYHAGWRLALGTVDALRWPRVTLNLRANPGLVAAWLAADVGHRIRLANLPDNVSFDNADLIVEGYTETLMPFGWEVTLVCAPYRPYHVFELAATSGDTGEFLGWLDFDICELAEILDTTETGVDVTTAQSLWSTAADDFPVDIVIDGERMTVTAAAGAANPQTLTVVRSANGVVKTHAVAAAVALADPGILGL